MSTPVGADGLDRTAARFLLMALLFTTAATGGAQKPRARERGITPLIGGVA